MEVLATVRSLEKKKIMLKDVVVENSTEFLPDEDQIDGQWRVMKVQSRTDGTPIYLKDNDGEYNWFFNNLNNSMTNRRNCLPLPRASDPDFAKLSEAYKSDTNSECKVRYTKWVEATVQAEAQKVQNKIFEWNIKNWSPN